MDRLAEFFAKNDVVLMGAIGVGKTTLVEHLLRESPLRYISLGSITRFRVEHGDEELASMLTRGGVWPLKYTLSLIQPYLNLHSPYVLDGLPKHPFEAEWLVQHLRLRPRPTQILLLQASSSITRQRALNRVGRLETPAEIESRIRSFEANIHPMLEILSSRLDAKVITLDASKLTPSQLVTALHKKLENLDW